MRGELIVSCDVGGTYARFDSYEVLRSTVQAVGVGQSPHRKGQRPPGKLILKKEYMCQKFKCFEDLLKQFLLEVNAKKAPIAACFAVAGPVINNRVQLMNRDWEIDGAKIAKEFQIKRVLIANDFVALGYGLLTVDDATECICLQDAPKLLNAPIACIGAGTGLGQCFLTPVTNERGVAEEDLDGEDVPALVYNCFPSEGGHAEFAPRSELEFELLTYLKQKFDQKHRVSVERVVSGIGLANVYEFFCATMPDKVNPEVKKAVDAAGDMKGAIIAQHKEDELCVKTMEVFMAAYGAETGVVALKWLPYGGLYLTGGMTPKNIDLIKDPEGPFMTALFDKGRVKSMLYTVPIFAVIAEDLGERGAHFAAYREFTKEVLAQAKKKKSWFGVNSNPVQTDSNDSIKFSILSVVAMVTTAYLLGQMRGSLRRH